MCCFSAAIESEHPDDPAAFPEQTAIAHKDDSASKTLAVVKLEVHKHKQETENVHLQSKRYVFKGKQSPLA